MNIAKPSTNTVFLIVVVAILGALAGSTSTYYYQKAHPIKIKAPSSTNQVPSSIKLEDTLPSGTVSPTAIAAKPHDFAGKQIKVRGRIVETAPNQYIIAGQEKDKSSSIKLDTRGSKADLKQYVSGYADPKAAPKDISSAPGAVTITGTVRIEASSVVLSVESISK